MTRSGWTGRRLRYSASSHGGSQPSRSSWSSHCVNLAIPRDFAGLPELSSGPSRSREARTVLVSAITGRIDESVRERMLAEAAGNPLALLELPRGWTPAAFAGGFGLPDTVSVSAKIEESFRRRLSPLPDDTRRLLLVAAAEPVGDPPWSLRQPRASGSPPRLPDPRRRRACSRPGRGCASVILWSVRWCTRTPSIDERRLVHEALAEATDPALDPDRRAWHLAAAAAGPDEAVAVELERSAGRAQARGGVAAAAAFLQRSVELTPDPATRAERALVAAQASFLAGAFESVQRLLAGAEAHPLDGLQSGRAALLRGQVAVVFGYGKDAPAAASGGCQAARTVRPRTRSECLSDRLQRGDVRRASW